MRIAIDIMGGDYAPVETMLGAIEFKKQYPGVEVVLVGDADAINAGLSNSTFTAADFTIVPTTEVVGMHESGAKAYAAKQNSSMAVGYKMLAKGEVDGFCGAGHSGAMMVGALFTVKAVSGVTRPCLSSHVPRINSRSGIILDIGANADCKPEHLRDFAILGSLYAQATGNENPTVGLLNLGEEEGKGNQLAKDSYELLKVEPRIKFIGNIEGRDILTPKVDVMVCDGYTGNIILKFGESFYNILKQFGGSLSKHGEAFNFENFGGTPILGVNGVCVVGHGISNAKAITSMMKHTMEVAESKMVSKIQQAFATTAA